MDKPLRCLIVEDSENDALLVVRQLRSGGYDVTWERVETAEAMRAALDRKPWDIVLADFKMPRFSGLAALELLKASGKGLPFIVVSGTIGEEEAVAAMKAGAHDYLMKGKLARLVPAVERELREAVLWREHRWAEVALQESEERLTKAFRSIPDALIISRLEDGKIVEVNNSWHKVFGYSREEVIGKSSLALNLFADSADRQRAIALIREQGFVRDFELQIRQKSGALRTAILSIELLEIQGEQYMLTVAQDITERRRAETALSASEVRYRRLFESAKDGILILNAETGRIVDVNPFLIEILGLSREESLGKKIWELGFFKKIIANQASFEELRQQEYIHYEDKPLETADGRRIDVEFVSNVYLMNHHKVIQCSIRDITTRKRAEARIREQAALLDKANDAIYATALDGTILYWNRGAERTYGWTIAEALNRKTTELISPDLAAAQALAATLLQQGSWSGERHQDMKNGGRVEVFSRLSLVRNEQGQPQSILAINTDITEKKQLEAQFLRAQRLDSIGALASGIAHDLNNVLAPIIIGVPLLGEMVKDQTARHLLKVMESSAQRGAAIVKQVLTFARGIEGERMPLQPRHLLWEMEKLAEETFPKSIRIESNVAADLWPVLGDATQLHQAVMNLCINARDAMPGGGVITLDAANVMLSKETAEKMPGAQPGSYACLRVTDTGMGIPQEIEAKIFEPFFTTKGVGKGTGLGLSTVVGIVRSHGGFVRVASKVGQGSTFELYLPATPTEQMAVRSESAALWPRAHGEGILVVDDEAAVREVTRAALIEFGYRVITAARGAEALRIFQERRREIQLVLTDMMMPEMDGATLIAALRVLDPAVRIVGITGMSDTAGLSGLKTLALSGMLAKPFTIEKLLAAIWEALPVESAAKPIGPEATPPGSDSNDAPPQKNQLQTV